MDALKRHGLLAATVLFGLLWLGLSIAANAYALLAGLCALWFASAEMTRRDLKTGILTTSLLALGSNAYLLNLKAASSGDSACNIDDLLNCDVINASAWSEMWGVPISLFGIALYGGLAAAAWSARREQRDGRFEQLVAWVGLGAVLYSAVLAAVSVQIGAVCVVCLTIYAANVLLLVAGWIGLRRRALSWIDRPLASLMSPSGRLLPIVSLVVLAVGIPSWTGEDPEAPIAIDRAAPDASAQLARLYKAPEGPVSIDGREPVLGDPNAPYTVVEFADYGCPHCARAKKELTDLVKARPEINVRFRVFPLDGACNPALQSGEITTPEESPRCQASIAGVCAQEQGKFWEYTTLLFANQGYFASEQLAFMAEEVGLDMASFASCMRSDASLQRVLGDAKAGAAANIRGTPAIFLRGIVGDDFVAVPRGAPAILQLVEAHRDGLSLPSP